MQESWVMPIYKMLHVLTNKINENNTNPKANYKIYIIIIIYYVISLTDYI